MNGNRQTIHTSMCTSMDIDFTRSTFIGQGVWPFVTLPAVSSAFAYRWHANANAPLYCLHHRPHARYSLPYLQGKNKSESVNQKRHTMECHPAINRSTCPCRFVAAQSCAKGKSGAVVRQGKVRRSHAPRAHRTPACCVSCLCTSMACRCPCSVATSHPGSNGSRIKKSVSVTPRQTCKGKYKSESIN